MHNTINCDCKALRWLSVAVSRGAFMEGKRTASTSKLTYNFPMKNNLVFKCLTTNNRIQISIDTTIEIIALVVYYVL